MQMLAWLCCTILGRDVVPDVGSSTAVSLALTGSSDVVDTSVLGLDRFDDAGHSRLATDPIALPFPERITSS